MSAVKRFVVRRDTWLRGERDGGGDQAESALMNHHGNMCCLGFLGRECGYDMADLEDVADPETMFEDVREEAKTLWPEKLLNTREGFFRPLNTTICSTIIGVNDDPDIADDERETQLTALFAQVELEVVFE